MSEQNTSEILDRLAGTYLAVEELNAAIPEIQKGFRENQQIIEDIRTHSAAAEELIKEAVAQGETLSSDAQKAIAQIEAAVKKAGTIEASISEKIAVLPDAETVKEELEGLSRRVEALDEHVRELENDYKAQLDDYDEKLEEMEKQLERLLTGKNPADRSDQNEKNSDQHDTGEKTRSGPDPDGLYSIEELIESAGGEDLLVVREKWRGDFCFLITSVSRGYASGIQYLNGEEYKMSRFRSDAEEFRLYDGPSRQKILDQQ